VRLLILTFYFTPDLSAGSFRATALVKALRERAPAGTEIDVLTSMPNRYSSYACQAPETETCGGCEIRRIALPAHQSDMRGQARAFARFARAVRAFVAPRQYDLVFATSSRLMTAALGAWIARSKRARLYLDVRDIFVDTITELLPPLAARVAGTVFAPIESWTMGRADRINLVSPGFAPYFHTRYGTSSFAWFTNGIDDEFLAAGVPAVPRAVSDHAATILYAGNIGEGQALHEIVPALAVALRGRARLVVIGDGGRRSVLEAAIARSGADNVQVQPPLARGQLIRAYQAADVLFLHLGRQAAFEKVLPSKVFEYAALGKPLLAGVAGYAARFIREEIDNAAVFAPGDAAAAVEAFAGLQILDRRREGFINKYRRSHISTAMAADILALAAQRDSGHSR
jgi:glycosyltransferase involved in cell wall biosynthesis